jgi:hypothetical protein
VEDETMSASLAETPDGFSDGYCAVAEELKRRILALTPEHPGILGITDVWDLFKVSGFDCRDLGPTMAQANDALAEAQQEYRRRVQDPVVPPVP